MPRHVRGLDFVLTMAFLGLQVGAVKSLHVPVTGLRSALPRHLAGGSLNLTPFTQALSPPGAQIVFKSLVSTYFTMGA